jgi:transcriptional regulator with XRE-family HTH domain
MGEKKTPNFAELIRDARTRKNLTVRALESLAQERGEPGLSRTYISLLENGKRKPTYEIACVLARVLGIDIETALASAFRARRDYDLEKEQRMIENLAKIRKLQDLDVDRIVAT